MKKTTNVHVDISRNCNLEKGAQHVCLDDQRETDDEVLLQVKEMP